MAYSIYQTDAVILGVQHIQEHDIMLRVFSPVFGYMRIISKGSRKSTSKLRANIQEYTVVHLAVVKGKEFFILTDIRSVFSFIQSKSVVTYLRQAEKLFFSDENDHGMQVNDDIYNMLLRICKVIIWMISEKKDSQDMGIIQDFFMVYVKGLQGFGEKMNIMALPQSGEMEFYIWMCEQIEEIERRKHNIQQALN